MAHNHTKKHDHCDHCLHDCGPCDTAYCCKCPKARANCHLIHGLHYPYWQTPSIWTGGFTGGVVASRYGLGNELGSSNDVLTASVAGSDHSHAHV